MNDDSVMTVMRTMVVAMVMMLATSWTCDVCGTMAAAEEQEATAVCIYLCVCMCI